ncbi:MAG: DNA-3-methyladenine glycosylase [Bacteroidales bacterium]|nr:DNA-3-methyladenine glycosylase [Bacteroidales bacterium]
MAIKLGREFFIRDVLDVAPDLPGKYLIIGTPAVKRDFMITEAEAYRGETDMACHASRGRTARTSVMYERGGLLYIYLVYGIHWMLNIVTGEEGNPQAVLIRGIEGVSGPGRLTKSLQIDRSWNGIDITCSHLIKVEDRGAVPEISTSPRIGIDYAGEPWISKPWRYFIP